MFTDIKTNNVINANLNQSVIRATLRPQDLIPAFLDVIKYTPEYQQVISSNNYEIKVIFEPYSDDDERWESEFIHYFLNENLFDLLNSFAPDGYYFGCHPGDGSDFGFWKIDEESLI